MTHLYSCKSEIGRDGNGFYRITKFDADLNVESSYITTALTCDCPAGERPMCRHREMLPKFLLRNAVNTFWMYDYDRDGWISQSVSEALGESAELAEAYSVILGEHVDAVYQGVPIIMRDDLRKPSNETMPHSVAASTGVFDTPSTGSNPVGAATINRRGF